MRELRHARETQAEDVAIEARLPKLVSPDDIPPHSLNEGLDDSATVEMIKK